MGDATHDEGGEMDEGDAVQSGGEEACDILVESDKEEAGDGALEQRDGVCCLGDATVDMRVQGTSVVRFFDDVVPVFFLFQQARGGSFFDMRVFGGHYGKSKMDSVARFESMEMTRRTRGRLVDSSVVVYILVGADGQEFFNAPLPKYRIGLYRSIPLVVLSKCRTVRNSSSDVKKWKK